MLDLYWIRVDHKRKGLIMRFLFSSEVLSHWAIDSISLFFALTFAMPVHQLYSKDCRSMRLGFLLPIWAHLQEPWSGLRCQPLSVRITVLSCRRFLRLSCILRGRTPLPQRCSFIGRGSTTCARSHWTKVSQVRRFLVGTAGSRENFVRELHELSLLQVPDYLLAGLHLCLSCWSLRTYLFLLLEWGFLKARIKRVIIRFLSDF